MMDSQFKLIESMNAVDETELCGGKAKLILLKVSMFFIYSN